MKILFWGLECPPRRGGIGVYMETMAEALVAAGHEVQWITARVAGAPAEERRRGVWIRRCYDVGEIRSQRLAERVGAMAREMGADWIEGADHWGECATLLALRRRPPVVIKAHGPQCLWSAQRAQIHYPWQIFTLGAALFRIAPQLIAEWRSLERADALIAPGPIMLESLRRQGVRLPARHAVIPNPVRPTTPAQPTELAAAPTLLMAGRIAFMKGIAHVAPILRRVAAACPDVRLELAGADSYARGIGSMADWLRRDLARNSVLDRVRFLGALNEAELDAAYRRAWVLIHPSLWESFGNVVAEAMVRQRPVVASCAGDLLRLLAGTENVNADPCREAFADAILRFLSDREARGRAAAGGREKALREWHPAVVAKQYLDFLTASR